MRVAPDLVALVQLAATTRVSLGLAPLELQASLQLAFVAAVLIQSARLVLPDALELVPVELKVRRQATPP